MKICLSLMLFSFLVTLQEGNACLGDRRYVAEVAEIVGRTVTFTCHFSFPEKMKIFCRNDCKDEDVLLATTSSEAQRGRYSMWYKTFPQASMTSVSVSITNLTQSDSGRYKCKSALTAAENQMFDLQVVDAQTAPQPQLTTTPAPTPETTPSSTSEPTPPPNITGLLHLLLTSTSPPTVLVTPPADESNRVPEGDREDDYQDGSPPVETPVN